MAKMVFNGLSEYIQQADSRLQMKLNLACLRGKSNKIVGFKLQACAPMVDVIKQTELKSQLLPWQTCYSISLAGSCSRFKQ